MKTIFTILVLLLASSAFGQTQTARFNLSWTNGPVLSDGSNQPTGTKVERSSNGTAGPWSQVALVPWPNNTMQDSIAGDTGGKIYCYRVRATNSAGDSPYSGVACGTTPAIGPVSLNSPTNLAVATLAPAATLPKSP